MNKTLTTGIFLFLISLIVVPLSLAYIANTSEYNIDSIHTGIAGANASTESYLFTSTTTYEQSGNINANTSSHLFELGWLDIYQSTCGNGLVEYLESCDSGNDNGGCPSECSSTCTINDCSEDSSHSSGGGGGGGLSFITAAVPLSTSTSANILLLKNGTTTLTFNNNNVPIEEIALTTNDSAISVSFILNSSNTSKIGLNGEVYKYITIDHNALSDNIIVSAKIKFSVYKSWLTDNSLSKGEVILWRYTDDWNVLTVKVLNEDSVKVYYQAESPGLSLFAITSKNTSSNNIIITEIIASSNNNISSENVAVVLTDTTTASSGNNNNTLAYPGYTPPGYPIPRDNSTQSKSLLEKLLSLIFGDIDYANFIKNFWFGMVLGLVFIVIIISSMVIFIVRYNNRKQIKILEIGEWILRQEVKGYPEDRLVDMLVQNHYNKKYIDHALELIHAKNYCPFIDKWLVDAHATGYSKSQLKEYLTMKGYHQSLIEEILRHCDSCKNLH